MDCEECRSMFWDFISDEIDNKQKKEVVSHLKKCEACREDLQIAKRVISDLQELPQQEVPEGLHEDLMVKIEQEARDNNLIPNKNRILNRGKQMRMAVAASVVLIAVGVIASGDSELPREQDAGIITATAAEEMEELNKPVLSVEEILNSDLEPDSFNLPLNQEYIEARDNANNANNIGLEDGIENSIENGIENSIIDIYDIDDEINIDISSGGVAELDSGNNFDDSNDIGLENIENIENIDNSVNTDAMIMTAEAVPVSELYDIEFDNMNARAMPEPMMAGEVATGGIAEIDNEVDDILYVFVRENNKNEVMDQYIDAIDNFSSNKQVTQTIYGSEIVVGVSSEDYNNVMDTIKGVNKNIQHMVVCTNIDVMDNLFIKIVFE